MKSKLFEELQKLERVINNKNELQKTILLFTDKSILILCDEITNF